MRKFLLYLGLSFFFTFSATTMYGIFRPVEIEPPTEQPPEAKKKADDLAYKKKLAEQKQIAEQLALEKKRQQCKSDLQKCLNDVGPKAMRMSLSGSAYNSAVRAMQNSCNRQYHCN